MLKGRRILLIVAGGIAAYKALDLIRRLREREAAVRCILTAGGARFVTALSVAALSEDKVYGELFSLTDEAEMGHIRLSREADLVVVAPATADILAKMAGGIADDLATTALLATDKPVLVAPAMNLRMWAHPATRRNVAQLAADGILFAGPGAGDLACGETGDGRMAEPLEIVDAIAAALAGSNQLDGRRALVTSGPTHEAVDPVRYIANRSSGKQGHAIAAALARLGAETTLITGPTALPDPPGITVTHVESAVEMQAACEAALPADIAVCAAAVADWRPESAAKRKIKKNGGAEPDIKLKPNPDILAALAAGGNRRPALVVGFAAETGSVIARATTKRREKGCDWIVANDVSPATGTFGGDDNSVHVITADDTESWPRMSKAAVAEKLAARIAAYFAETAASDKGGAAR